MKLYFYFLEHDRIRTEECEVEEKPKTYKPVMSFPSEYIGSFVEKENIGKILGIDRNTVILSEKNNERAAGVFVRSRRDMICNCQNEIKEATKEINEHRRSISMIKEWRKSDC